MAEFIFLPFIIIITIILCILSCIIIYDRYRGFTSSRTLSISRTNNTRRFENRNNLIEPILEIDTEQSLREHYPITPAPPPSPSPSSKCLESA